MDIFFRFTVLFLFILTQSSDRASGVSLRKSLPDDERESSSEEIQFSFPIPSEKNNGDDVEEDEVEKIKYLNIGNLLVGESDEEKTAPPPPELSSDLLWNFLLRSRETQDQAKNSFNHHLNSISNSLLNSESKHKQQKMRKAEKRSPACLRKCMAKGYLHPAQCHSLC